MKPPPHPHDDRLPVRYDPYRRPEHEHPESGRPEEPQARNERWLAGLFSVLLIAGVLSPLLEYQENNPDDNFPFSYYPMFTSTRGESYRITYLAGTDAAGARHPVSYQLAGAGGFNQVRRQIRDATNDGRADVLCADVAEEVLEEDDAPYTDLVEVHVVSGRFRFDDYFAGDKAPYEEEVHATCPVAAS